MTNQTIEQAVEELDDWANNVVEHECERIWIKAFFRKALQAQRDAGARDVIEHVVAIEVYDTGSRDEKYISAVASMNTYKQFLLKQLRIALTPPTK